MRILEGLSKGKVTVHTRFDYSEIVTNVSIIAPHVSCRAL